MDSNGFKKCIEMWYREVKERSDSPWLMILDNCGGHELAVILPGVRFEFLPPRSTAKYQPLDLGLIAHCKIKYRSILLRSVILMIEARAAGRANFTEDSGRGKWGIRERQLPHVAGAMEMFTKSWSTLSRNKTLRCWKNSQCLSEMHITEVTSIINGVTDGDEDIIYLTEGRALYCPSDGQQMIKSVAKS